MDRHGGLRRDRRASGTPHTGELRFTLTGHAADVVGLDWSPDSTRLATGSDDGTAKVCGVTDEGATRAALALGAGHEQRSRRGVAFSPDGERLMTGDTDITAVKIWDVSLAGDAEWANLPAVPALLGSAEFTPDGERLVASSADGSATIWDACIGEAARDLRIRNDPAARSPDPDLFAIDRLLDAPSGADVLAIDVSPDGRLIATASADGVRVWDAATGKQMVSVGPVDLAYDVAWSPDGDRSRPRESSRAGGLCRSWTAPASRSRCCGTNPGSRSCPSTSAPTVASW